MTLPLPYILGDDDDPAQGNFDTIKKQFPLSRKHMKIEAPHAVGDAGEPAFSGTWVNYDTATFRGARFWKDPMGIVHIEGLIKSGTINTTAFVLPEGYRPGNALIFASDTSTGHGRLDVAVTGNVLPVSGGTGYFSINCNFKQES